MKTAEQTVTDVPTIDFTCEPTAAANAVVVPEAPPPARSLAPTSSEATILSIIERAARDPAVDIDKMERLIAMQERVLAGRAKVEYDNAMADAQEEMQPVRANQYNQQTRSKYADYYALDEAIRPIYTKHGFSLSFGTGKDAPDNHVDVVCCVSHRGGHREYPHLAMPADGKGAKGGDVMTRTHATGAAITYGKRYLLGMIFNLSISFEDDDGNGASPAISNDSWGPGGKQGAVDQARADGLMDNSPKASAEQIKNMHKWLNNATGTLQLSGQTTHSIGQFWMGCKKRRAQIEDCLPAEYAKLEKVYNDALTAAQARN